MDTTKSGAAGETSAERAGSVITSRPITDGQSLRDAVRHALAKWERTADTYRFQSDVRFAVAAFDYNVKPNAHALAEEWSDDSQQRVVGCLDRRES